MKCPKCGLENPSSITVCQCGYSLATGPDLEKSLAKHAQEIREEVKKIHTVDSDVPREEISTIMKRAFGFWGILVWLLVILPLVWEWWFPETAALDWKQTLVAGLLIPFFYGVGAAIGALITARHSPTARR